MEPMERVVVDVPETYQGNVMTALGARKAILDEHADDEQLLPHRVPYMPSRGLFGYRSQFLTDTHGEGIMNTIFDGYEEWCGDIQICSTGSPSALIPATPSPWRPVQRPAARAP